MSLSEVEYFVSGHALMKSLFSGGWGGSTEVTDSYRERGGKSNAKGR